MKPFKVLFFVVSILCVNVFSDEQGIKVLRDTEIEEILTDMAQKIFDVAKLRLKPHVYVINSSEIDAFTIGNGYIFITSGLLLKYSNPLHIMAIICHETGHIAAKHVERKIAEIKASSRRFGVAAIASVLAGALTGSADAMGVLLGYMMADERFYLRFSRAEEFAADILAAKYLEKLRYSSDLLIESFAVFHRMDLLNNSGNIPIYVSTHPKIDDRIRNLSKNRTFKHYSDPKLQQKYQHVIAKIKAYIGVGNPEYLYDDTYTKIIYLYKIGRVDEAVSDLKKLIKLNNDNFYYKETLAQILHEIGKLENAVEVYKQIYSNKVNSLIKIDYASTLIDLAVKNSKLYSGNLKMALDMLAPLQYEIQIDSDVFRLLGKIYGLQKNEGMSSYFIAREQMILGNYTVAFKLFRKSIKLLPKNTPAYKMAKYLMQLIKDHRV